MDGIVKIWNATTGKEIFKRKQRAGILSFSPEDNTLAINCGGHVELWKMNYNSNYERDKPMVELFNVFLLPYNMHHYNTAVDSISLAWAPNGRFLAAGHRSVAVYDIEKGEKVSQIIPSGIFYGQEGPKDAAHTLVFSPDGKSLFTGANEGIYRYPVMVKQE